MQLKLLHLRPIFLMIAPFISSFVIHGALLVTMVSHPRQNFPFNQINASNGTLEVKDWS